MADVNVTPTADLYGQLQRLADHFNQALFNGQLPPTVITLQRSVHTAGHFSASRWKHVTGMSVSELALNPTYFANRPLLSLCQTVVHELCHLWQHMDGSASRPGYHNAAWANHMEAIGLMPSATGRPGGAKTGQKMADYPVAGGAFMKACEELVAAKFALNWIDQNLHTTTANRIVIDDDFAITGEISARLFAPLGSTFPDFEVNALPPARPNKRKAKYQCPSCRVKVWGKPGLHIACGACAQTFEEDSENDDNGLIIELSVPDDT